MRYVIKHIFTGGWLDTTLATVERYGCPQWAWRKELRTIFGSADEARKALEKAAGNAHGVTYEDGRVVRLLSPAEAKRKYAAGVLRKFADSIRDVYPSPEDLRALADKEWPTRATKREGAG